MSRGPRIEAAFSEVSGALIYDGSVRFDRFGMPF